MEKPHVYQIKIGSQLDSKWSSWFDGMVVTSVESPPGQSVTVLTGLVADQAALHGILARIRDLGLPLLSVARQD